MSADAARRIPPWLVWLGLFGAAVVVAGAVVLPVRTGQVGYDTAASVLYFDRILAGERLEAFLSVTPKPLLTLVDGLLHALIPDWRAISWLAVAVFGLDVVLASRLALRLAGPPAAAFAGAAMIASAALLSDVALAYAMTWALLGWLGAGLALTDPRGPRFGLAGLGLLVAGTARFESNLLAGVALLGVAGWWLVARRREVSGPPRRTWLLALGLLAVPIQGVHDWLLSGDPFYSLAVPVRGTPSGELLGPLGRLGWLAQRELDNGAILLLAIAGLAALIVARRWSIVGGLAVLGPGIAAFLVFLELRGVYVSSRYAAPIDLAVAFAASIGYAVALAPGFAAAATSVRQRVRPAPTGPRRPPLAAVVIALVAGALFAAPFAPLSPGVLGTARSNLTLHANAIAAEAAIRTARPRVAPVTGGTDDPVQSASVLVPVLLRPQMALDLDLDLTQIAGLSADALDPAQPRIRPGQLVYHDRRGDPDDPRLAVLEASAPTSIGPYVVVPVASDPRLGWWLVRIENGSG